MTVMLDVAGGIIIGAAVIGLFVLGLGLALHRDDVLDSYPTAPLGIIVMLTATGVAIWIVFMR
ncbi:MAG: hypothetical protein HYU58_16295 [Proteobacteria bacterium]|nr:hypothetical protein [Pseudomonadota bacterium]